MPSNKRNRQGASKSKYSFGKSSKKDGHKRHQQHELEQEQQRQKKQADASASAKAAAKAKAVEAGEREEEVRRAILLAVKYVNGFPKCLPGVVNGSIEEGSVMRSVSRNMRVKLSPPVVYASLHIFTRLAEFSDEAESAQEENRSASYPLPKCHLDFTALTMWAEWVEIIELEADKTLQDHDWNKFASVATTLHMLTQQIWEKHFNVEF